MYVDDNNLILPSIIYLAILLKEIAESSRYDTPVNVALCSSSDAECFPTTSLK